MGDANRSRHKPHEPTTKQVSHKLAVCSRGPSLRPCPGWGSQQLPHSLCSLLACIAWLTVVGVLKRGLGFRNQTFGRHAAHMRRTAADLRITAATEGAALESSRMAALAAQTATA